jgi:hypothetical protein
MLDQGLKAVVVGATTASVAEGGPEQKRISGWRRFLRPSFVGCLGLALAVFLWGYNYKLSLYHERDLTSSAQTAKLWVDQRHAVGAVVAPLQTPDHAFTAAPDLNLTHCFDLICVGAVVIAPVKTLPTQYSKSLLPLRSPPSDSFSA